MVETVTKNEVIEKIRTVYDPEIPVNVYDLGLIYTIKITGNNDVHINMTLTSPNCPVAQTLPRDVAQAFRTIGTINNLSLDVVWEPTWTKDMMSDEARLTLNLF